jgi:hypothetical protein
LLYKQRTNPILNPHIGEASSILRRDRRDPPEESKTEEAGKRKEKMP